MGHTQPFSELSPNSAHGTRITLGGGPGTRQGSKNRTRVSQVQGKHTVCCMISWTLTVLSFLVKNVLFSFIFLKPYVILILILLVFHAHNSNTLAITSILASLPQSHSILTTSPPPTNSIDQFCCVAFGPLLLLTLYL